MSGETENEVSGWTIDTLHAHIQRQIDDLRNTLDERHAVQTAAQTAAMDAAMVASSKAVAATLLAVEKSVDKAELSAESNTERIQDMDARFAVLVSRPELDALLVRIAALNSRADRADSADTGVADASRRMRSTITIAVVLVTVILGVVAVLFGVYFSR